MFDLIDLYRQRLGLEDAAFTLIEHDDAIVAIVYQVTLPDRKLILKICKSAHHFYREIYYLKRLAGIISVPRIEKTVQPAEGVFGAVLMEYLPGRVLKIKEFTDALSFEMGAILAKIHLNRALSYGDLTRPQELNADPRVNFAEKFEESFAECMGHLPGPLMERCSHYFKTHLDSLNAVDGPCIVHRDYRPGNVIADRGKIQGIIDWSSGRAGFAEEDFCCMEHSEWPLNPKCKRPFLEGYASIRPLPDFDSVMVLLRLNKAIATIGYLVKTGALKSSGAYLYQLNRQFLTEFSETVKEK